MMSFLIFKSLAFFVIHFMRLRIYRELKLYLIKFLKGEEFCSIKREYFLMYEFSCHLIAKEAKLVRTIQK